MKLLNKFKLQIVIFIIVSIFFWPFLFQGRLPVPSDALVGLYHPWRDYLSSMYPNGYPYKNSLITDPVRQQYPYRLLAIHQLKEGYYPVWNPYSFSGTPLLANIQTGVLYPLNILFWIFSDINAWSMLVLLQPFLAAIFMSIYLKQLGLKDAPTILGSISFAFSGFMVSWMTWNTIGHTIAWLPLALYAVDKFLEKRSVKWIVIMMFSGVCALLAGHLQTALYFFCFLSIYVLVRTWEKVDKYSFFKIIIMFLVMGFLISAITSIQLIPTVRFIFESAREADLTDWNRLDWFIPWQHIIQFLAPDFFGNPTTGNYWGVWNYGEFVGYTGIVSMIFALISVTLRKDKKTLFFLIALLASLTLALPNPIGKIPYSMNVPFLSTMQPSRILSILTFCLSILGALGFDFFLKEMLEKQKKSSLLFPVGLVLSVFALLWLFVTSPYFFQLFTNNAENILISRRNLILPSSITLFILMSITVSILKFNTKKAIVILTGIIILIAVSDQLRFALKFTPFTEKNLFFPTTKTLTFLQKNIGYYRVMTTDRRILPPNTSVYYRIPSVDGYDPLYLKRYADVIATWTRNAPNTQDSAFNRILTPERIDSFWLNVLGVKYILSLEDIKNPNLNLVFKEGETAVYENTQVFPRAFLAEDVVRVDSGRVIEAMYNNHDKLRTRVYTDEETDIVSAPLHYFENVEIIEYRDNQISIETQTKNNRLLVLTDIFYPSWKASVNGVNVPILKVDHVFRGVIVPVGKSIVTFQTTLF